MLVTCFHVDVCFFLFQYTRAVSSCSVTYHYNVTMTSWFSWTFKTSHSYRSFKHQQQSQIPSASKKYRQQGDTGTTQLMFYNGNFPYQAIFFQEYSAIDKDFVCQGTNVLLGECTYLNTFHVNPLVFTSILDQSKMDKIICWILASICSSLQLQNWKFSVMPPEGNLLARRFLYFVNNVQCTCTLYMSGY